VDEPAAKRPRTDESTVTIAVAAAGPLDA
jgi:hypothetical protein